MASGHVEYDGGRLWHQEAGEGPALLLHAGGADSRMWDGHLERFAQAYRTVRIDLPGAGASPFPDKPYAPNDLLGRLLDALEIQRAALVGVSAGGGLAIDFALGRPRRTWALVVVASGPRGIEDIPPDPRMQAFSQAIVAGTATAPPSCSSRRGRRCAPRQSWTGASAAWSTRASACSRSARRG